MVAALPISVQIAYDLATGVGAKRIVQVGAWAALSVALARAVHTNTGGRGGLLVSTDLDGPNVVKTRAELRRAGVEEYAYLCRGDARIALQSWEGPFDFVWLGCSAEMATDVLEILDGRLRDGAVVAGFAAQPASLGTPSRFTLAPVAGLR